jgi:Ca-activated chloride channel family protein
MTMRAWLLLLVGLGSLMAQVAAFRSEARLVEVPAMVLDRSGHYIDGLSRDQFELDEDGSPQPLVAFESHTSAVSCAFLLDTTGSMTHTLPVLKNAVIRVLDEMRADDAVAIFAFNSSLMQLQDFTTDKDAAKKAVLRTRAEGKTALFDAIADVAKTLASRSGKKAIVVFTDGDDNSSGLTLTAAMNRSKKAGIPVYAIAQGEALERKALLDQLKKLADATGGSSYAARKPADIESVFMDIVGDLKHTYLLAYKPPAGDSKWRRIAVSVRGVKGCQVRAKEGYDPR